jgi:putative hydrolase of the HAD superfamily
MLTVDRFGDGVEPADCVFIDDIEHNCDAANQLGMTAVHYTDSDQAMAAVEEALAG